MRSNYNGGLRGACMPELKPEEIEPRSFYLQPLIKKGRMKKISLHNFLAVVLACGLPFVLEVAIMAAEPIGPYVPVGPPPSVQENKNKMTAPEAPLPPVRFNGPKHDGVKIGQSYDGINFFDSSCFCSPPDTNAAVGNNFVVETVNFQIRVFDKTTGSILLDEPLQTFFEDFSAGDPYVVYDDNADRWYVTAFDSTAQGLYLAVSFGNNPLRGFHTYHLTEVGGFPDYPKLGFNMDAIFISYNDFGSGGAAATIASIDKAAALSGTLIYFVSHPAFQFRAMPPAQMHKDHKSDFERDEDQEGAFGRHEDPKGGVESDKDIEDSFERHKDHKGHKGGVQWFVSTDGTDAGGNTIRVTKMTNYLSNTPNFTYTSLPVKEYRYAQSADQPGGTITTFPNTTTTQVHYNNGHLVTAMASSTAADGFIYHKGLYYQIDVNGKTPRLIKEGVIDPGPGVAVQMPSVAEDQQGNLGLTWMESSNDEYLSMWVGTVDPNGNFSAQQAAPGLGFFFVNFRIGDYSTIVVDPSDGKTFWAANEYIGPDGDSNIWRTHITSFRAGHRQRK